MTKKRKRWTIAGIVIFLLLAVGFMIIYCFPLKYHSHDETNTIEFLASLKMVEKVNSVNSTSKKTVKGYYITTNEYACSFVIRDGISLNEENISLLCENDTIYFRMEKTDFELIENYGMLENPDLDFTILSLKTENYEIFTLEDSDNELNKGILIGKIICGVACACLLVGAAILIVILAKTRKAL